MKRTVNGIPYTVAMLQWSCKDSGGERGKGEKAKNQFVLSNICSVMLLCVFGLVCSYDIVHHLLFEKTHTHTYTHTHTHTHPRAALLLIGLLSAGEAHWQKARLLRNYDSKSLLSLLFSLSLSLSVPSSLPLFLSSPPFLPLTGDIYSSDTPITGDMALQP